MKHPAGETLQAFLARHQDELRALAGASAARSAFSSPLRRRFARLGRRDGWPFGNFGRRQYDDAMAFPLPANEADRIQALYRFAILDTPPEGEFDRLTRLAARALRAPTALITLVDHDRQWFKSRFGFAAEQSAREIAFCAHTVVSPEGIVVEDARVDPRFCHNPLVIGPPYIRAYAGAPIQDRGLSIGSFAVIDYEPRAFGEEERGMLADFAAITLDELHLRARTALAKDRERESLERLGTLVSVAPIAIFTLAEGRTVASWNRGAESIFGVAAGEIVARDLGKVLPALIARLEELRSIEPLDPKAPAPQALRAADAGREVRVVVPGGQEIVVRMTLCGLGTSHDLLVIAEDVTEAKRLEAGLLRADRLASLGVLAAGVAHEVNNPLSYILNNLEYAEEALQKLSPPPGASPDVGGGAMHLHGIDLHGVDLHEVAAALRDARGGVLVVKDIVRSLGRFTRPSDPGGGCDPKTAIDAAVRMTAAQVRPRARLRKEYGELPLVNGSESRLSQVFVNLLLNAAQAIPEGDGREHVITVRAHAGNDTVIAEVSDTGTGMTPDVLAHAFDPLFTTKDADRGTGLGLFVCQQIVSELDGRIDVESEPGRGTTFRVELPVRPGPSSAAPSGRRS